VTTTNKDFRVKNGLIVEGNSATVNGNQVITTSDTQTLTNKTLTTPKINENVDLTATSTELNYVDGVTSAIQTQIDAKAPLASPTFTGTVTIPAGSAITGVPYLATANTFTGGVQQITTANAETIGLIVKGTESQTANLQEWHNFDGTVRASLRNTGALNLGTLITGTQLSVIPINNTTTGIVVRGATSQSNDLQQWQNNAGTTLASIQASGNLRISGSMGYVGGGGSQLVFQSGNNSAYFAVTSTAGSYPSLQVIGISTQTSDLQQWRGSAGTVLSGINSAGQIYAGTTTSINGSTTTAITSAAYTSATVAVFTYGGTSLVQAGQRVTVASVSGGTYNGTWTVTAVTSTTFTVLGSGFTDVAGTGGTFTLSAVGSFVAGTAAITPIVVRGATSQTANLQQWQDSAGTLLARIQSDGAFVSDFITGVSFVTSTGKMRTGGTTNYGAQMEVTTTATTNIGQVIRGIASQTANLQEWQNSSGTILANVSSSGEFTVPSLTVSGNFTVNGTTTNINSTNLVVEDKNIILGDVETPTDITADGGGITLKGTTDKTFNWVDSTDSWTSSEHINLASGKSYSMNGTALKDVSETLTNKTLTSPTIDTPLLTLSTTSSTTDGRIAWDSTNDKILVGGTLNSVSQAVEFASSTLTISTPTFTTNAYTVVLADKDKWLELSNGATAGTLNIPTDATANFAIGSQINILQTGAGQITIAAVTPATTTVNGSPGLKLRGQWSVATIVKRAANTWVAVGDLSA
jgi:hypothetical protein